MNIILCHTDDKEAIWLYLELKKKGTPIELITPEQLMMAEEWTQNVETDSDNYFIKTKSGITINSQEKYFLFNRTRQAQAPIWNKATETEKNYSASEMNAMLMGWLYQVQLKNVIYNPPVGYSLSGTFWSKQQWTKAAHSAEFDVVDQKSPNISDKLILVVDKEVIGSNLDTKTKNKALALSTIAKSPFLQLRLNPENHFKDADTFPALRPYGETLVNLINNKIYES